MDWKQAEKATFKIVLYSIVDCVNGFQTFSDEEKENLLNIIFNVLTNSLNPDAALALNNLLFEAAENIKKSRHDKEKQMKVIFDQLNWKDE